MKALNIIETAYRATIEEQDDTTVWITHAMKNAGADLGVLLRGNAVNYGVRGQDASGLALGGIRQTQPPHLEDDIEQLVEKGVAVYYVEDDLTTRGIAAGDLVPGLRAVAYGKLPALFEQYDRVWHW